MLSVRNHTIFAHALHHTSMVMMKKTKGTTKKKISFILNVHRQQQQQHQQFSLSYLFWSYCFQFVCMCAAHTDEHVYFHRLCVAQVTEVIYVILTEFPVATNYRWHRVAVKKCLEHSFYHITNLESRYDLRSQHSQSNRRMKPRQL